MIQEPSARRRPWGLPGLLFHEPEGDAARAMFTPPDDPEAAIAAIVAMSWSTGCTSKFVWPVPDKGLAKRLHRIRAPTLIIWGKHDALISSEYAAELGTRIPNSRVEIIDRCGHIPQVERPDQTMSLVSGFLG